MTTASSSSSALDVPFVEVICGYPTRETLCLECPALLLLMYEHVVAELQGGRRAYDPFRGTSRQDHLSELLSASSALEIFDNLYPTRITTTTAAAASSAAEPSPGTLFWQQLRAALEATWAPPYDRKARAILTQVRGQSHFHFCGLRDTDTVAGEGLSLHPVSLERALSTSKRFLRTATTCALDGSTDALEGRQQELKAVLQLARLVPHTVAASGKANDTSRNGTTAAAAVKEVTPEGLNFCMVSLQQRWWVLVNAALERTLLLTRGDGTSSAGGAVTKPLLWQLLAVLTALDTAQYIFAFPDKTQDPAGHHLLARLSEVGLVYPMLSDGRKCFVLSPDFTHAIHWHASAPLSLTFTQQLPRTDGAGVKLAPNSANSGDVRREDADTIITETNFRLYAYTRDPDLLNILNQFADLEEVVNDSLCCYRVSRDSFAAAMRKGITATQVLRFLSLRAHPSMLRRYEERNDAQAGANSSNNTSSGYSSSVRRHGLADAVATLVVPQSFCDQVRMWESECRRVVFEHHVTLLRNVSAAQQHAIMAYLTDAGEADAVVHMEVGYMVVREEVFERVLAPLLS